MHRCNKKFLAYMGVDDDLDDEDDVHNSGAEHADLITVDISYLYGLEGKHCSDAIELQGTSGALWVFILLDTEKLALPLQQIKPFRVCVGNGGSLICSHASIQTRLDIQNHVFFVDLHILPVHGLDVILGMAWLKSLRRVTNDYENTMCCLAWILRLFCCLAWILPFGASDLVLL